MKNLIDALYKGIVTIEFTKIDTGEIRIMPSTLNKDFHKQEMEVKRYNSSDTILCYGLDVKAWRDIRVNTITDWYEGMPKEEK